MATRVFRPSLLRGRLPVAIFVAFGVAQHAVAQETGAPLPLQSAVERSRPAAVSGRTAKHAKHRQPPSNAIPVRIVRTVRVDPVQPAAMSPPSDAGRRDITEAAPAKPVAEAHPVPPAPTVDSDIKTFCGNVGRAASDARVAWQAAKLTELEAALKGRIVELEAKIVAHREWLARRDEVAHRADDAVVAIYAKMRPDAAATQLASLDDATAAAVLLKLNPRNAGAILGEIPAERAARLTDAMTGNRARDADEKKPS